MNTSNYVLEGLDSDDFYDAAGDLLDCLQPFSNWFDSRFEDAMDSVDASSVPDAGDDGDLSVVRRHS